MGMQTMVSDASQSNSTNNPLLRRVFPQDIDLHQPGKHSPTSLAPNIDVSSTMSSPDLSIRLPKNKSTGNLLAPVQTAHPDTGRMRFSFDAGSEQEIKSLKRYILVHQ